ncbi:MAG: hypothetical protein B7Y31_04810 [Novosphingobium sp. 16-62-11]|uniref:DUF3298 and DUF4163 domain-containing protein n=1 Tax=Novosphingobium sp. 17-62-19 TaxID=1970406 RepID=UPI000BC42D67|nr:DUF3298 and DUF4163 domain-containing protein [Novosphingobium sp. 17-62-19]OYX94328.1 MAG: hypothetical protein B7Y74_07355 [Novosphingobium sp. 35-62-5]OYZ42811.1 MAG: hypothetical protein B7Y31_04810 [Novosphingobium sp. 16-62-11]OZA20648.1 MAG: hypothetical protein B7X90_05215 [Novosphingobium sp. 17-62-19]HQS98494.1 DUF3298 and DUF4163 domain-containing protein [Novosphingobium sp.]
MRLVLMGAVLALGACSVKEDEPTAAASESAYAAQSTAAVVTQAPVAARDVHEQNELYQFDYSYPASAGAIPALKALLDAELEKARGELKVEATEGQNLAKKNGFPFNPYSYSVEWKVVTDLPAWLSMSTLIGTFSGGAHPNYVFDAMLWDRVAGQRRAPADLFVSKAALSEAIRAPFCKELDRQRAKKRGGQDGGQIEEFSKCIDPVEETVILGSSTGKAFDRIGILVAPYSAGPYAEGDYEVTVPVTPKVLAAVKPQFKPAFVAQ